MCCIKKTMMKHCLCHSAFWANFDLHGLDSICQSKHKTCGQKSKFFYIVWRCMDPYNINFAWYLTISNICLSVTESTKSLFILLSNSNIQSTINFNTLFFFYSAETELTSMVTTEGMYWPTWCIIKSNICCMCTNLFAFSFTTIHHYLCSVFSHYMNE